MAGCAFPAYPRLWLLAPSSAISLSQQACPFVQVLPSLLKLLFQLGLAYLQGLAQGLLALLGLLALQQRWKAAQLLKWHC